MAMSIPEMGNTEVQALARHFNHDLDDFEGAVMAEYDFGQIPGFNEALGQCIWLWFQNEDNWCLWMELRERAENGGGQT